MTNPPRRAIWAVLLVVSAFWIGFCGGMLVAGQLLVPEGSGMAGPAIALAYGLGAAAVAVIAAALVAWKAPVGALRAAALIAAILDLAITAVLVVRVVQQASGS